MGWIILACVASALFFISLVRVGGLAQYSGEGLLAQIKVGALRFTLYPPRPKKEKARKPSREKRRKKVEKPSEEVSPAKPGGTLELVRRYLPLAAEAAGRFRRKVRIDRLYLDFISAATDPAAAAMNFGYANAAIGMILPLFEHNFHIKERRIRTAADFAAKEPTIFIHAELSLTIGQCIALGARLAVRFLKITLQARARQKTEKEAV